MMITIGRGLCLYRQQNATLWVGYDHIFFTWTLSVLGKSDSPV
jgi:hypothetical protein